MISTVDHLLVLYHDEKKLKSRLALEALEKVDDEGDRIGVTFIKVNIFFLSNSRHVFKYFLCR